MIAWTCLFIGILVLPGFLFLPTAISAKNLPFGASISVFEEAPENRHSIAMARIFIKILVVMDIRKPAETWEFNFSDRFL